MDIIIRNATLRDRKDPVDIAIDKDKIAAVQPKIAEKGRCEIDSTGSLVLPGLFNLHFHADKCLLGEIMRPNVPGTLPEAIEITNEFKRKYDPEEVASRAIRALEAGVKNGTSFFRLFADVGTIGGLRAARGLLLAREKMRRYCDIQVVAFPQEGIARDPGAAELMDEAMREGCDIVGGLPWYEYTDADAREHIDICFQIAKRHDRDIHMLVDDTDDPNSRSLEYLAVKTMREGFQDRVAASHCGAMGSYNDVYAAKIVDMVGDHHFSERTHQFGLLRPHRSGAAPARHCTRERAVGAGRQCRQFAGRRERSLLPLRQARSARMRFVHRACGAAHAAA
jgi:cytosine deaminase